MAAHSRAPSMPALVGVVTAHPSLRSTGTPQGAGCATAVAVARVHRTRRVDAAGATMRTMTDRIKTKPAPSRASAPVFRQPVQEIRERIVGPGAGHVAVVVLAVAAGQEGDAAGPDTL